MVAWVEQGTHGVADRLEEEEEEQTDGPSNSGYERGEDRKHGAHHTVYGEQQRRVDEVEQHHAHEAADRECDLAVRVHLARKRLADPDVLVDEVVDCHGRDADLGAAG